MPCASTYPIVAGSHPASSSAARTSAACETGLGTVAPPVRPPWFTTLERITARMSSPSRSASASRLSVTAPEALARDVAGAAFAECPAPTVLGEPTALRELKVLLRVHVRVDATREREIALARAQARDGEMDRGERGRARGVQRDARAGEIEGERDPVRDGGVHCVGRDAVVGTLDELVVVPHHAGEHADRAAGQTAR